MNYENSQIDKKECDDADMIDEDQDDQLTRLLCLLCRGLDTGSLWVSLGKSGLEGVKVTLESSQLSRSHWSLQMSGCLEKSRVSADIS